MLKFALIICFATIMIHALAGEPRTVSFLSTFDDLKGWKDNSSEKSPHSYSLTNGALCIYTRAQTRDRVKVATTNHLEPPDTVGVSMCLHWARVIKPASVPFSTGMINTRLILKSGTAHEPYGKSLEQRKLIWSVIARHRETPQVQVNI